MGAERDGSDTDGGDTAGRDRAHRALGSDREPPWVASGGQGSDNPDGESSLNPWAGFKVVDDKGRELRVISTRSTTWSLTWEDIQHLSATVPEAGEGSAT